MRTSTATPRRTARALAALVLFALGALVLFGWPVLRAPSGSWVGADHPDVASSVWFLAWWPHAIGHGLNPLHPHLLWAPPGVDLSWRAALPGPALLAWPLTALAGPVVSYNVLVLLSPILAAWTAYLLCHRLTGRFWASVAGGWVFGFSSYLVAQMRNHLNVTLVFPVPLMVHLVHRRLSRDISNRFFIPALGAVLVLQFLIFTETFLLACLVGGVVALLLAARSSGEQRLRWEETIAAIFGAGVLAGAVLSPYLLDVVRHIPTHPLHRPSENSADLLNFILPSKVTLVGPHMAVPNLSEAVGYAGIPLLLVVALFARARPPVQGRRLLLTTAGVIAFLALGPVLHVDGHASVPLPWSWVERLPVLDSILPARLLLYAWLAAAVMVAVWLSEERRLPSSVQGVLALAVVVSLVPNVGQRDRLWHTPVRLPRFVTAGEYRSIAPSGASLLVIPYAQCGRSMLWQVRAGWAFSLAEGYVGPDVPQPFHLRAVEAFYTGRPYPGVGADVAAFVADHDVRAVVVADGTPGQWDAVFASLGTGRELGGARVWAVAASYVATHRTPGGRERAAVDPSGFPGCSLA